MIEVNQDTVVDVESSLDSSSLDDTAMFSSIQQTERFQWLLWGEESSLRFGMVLQDMEKQT